CVSPIIQAGFPKGFLVSLSLAVMLTYFRSKDLPTNTHFKRLVRNILAFNHDFFHFILQFNSFDIVHLEIVTLLDNITKNILYRLINVLNY
ncbi:hypothetical protein ABE79_11945, partial [Proteus mirabilis]